MDTYTITFTNGDKTTFTVTNGKDGSEVPDFDVLMHTKSFAESAFNHGYLSPYNGKISASDKHIYTPQAQEYPFAIHIKASANYRFSVCFYDSDGTTFAGGTSNTQSLTVPANTPFRITVHSYWADKVITDVAAYAQEITVTGNPYAADIEHAAESLVRPEPEPLTVKGINHAGWWQAPQNTLHAYREAKKQGFTFVECDIRFTADNVPVLLHNEVINGVARNKDGSLITQTTNISDITLEQAKEYDFGVCFSKKYAGTSIATLEEFLTLCKRLGLYPYIDIKDYSITQEQANAIFSALSNVGFSENATLLVWSHESFDKLQKLLPRARYGFAVSAEAHENDTRAMLDMFQRANAFLDVSVAYADEWLPFCKQNGIPVEVWTVDTKDALIALDPYISGVTSNKLNAPAVFEEYYMKD